MSKKRIHIPSSGKNEDIELVAGKLFMWGYAVQKGKYEKGEAKGIRYIDIWRGDEDEKTGSERN